MSYSLNEALALLLRPGTLSVIAGRPGMGATSLAIQALRKAKSGRVLLFSLDEPATRIRERSGYPDWTIDDLGFLTPDMVREALHEITEDDVAVVIDPLELMWPPDSDRPRSKEREFHELTAALRSLAREYDVPIVCTAFLPRPLDVRNDKRPHLDSFAEKTGWRALSSVDTVLLVYRSSYYNGCYNKTEDHTAELYLAKNSAGGHHVLSCQWTLDPDRGTLVFSEGRGKTYVMSDLHGRYDLYRQMLREIDFSSADELYILGDAIDKGDEGIDILLNLMERPNAHLLMGDHEDMARTILWEYAFAQDREYLNSAAFTEKTKRWMEDGGEATLAAFQKLDWWEQERIVVYLYSLPYRKQLKVNGRTYHLSHTLPDEPPVTEDSQKRDYLWGEPDYRLCYGSGKTFLTGHTPTHLIDPAYHGRIWQGNGHVAIDCDAVCGGALGCVCLETQEEYFVK